jgi:hypothetical protein
MLLLFSKHLLLNALNLGIWLRQELL